MGPPDTWQRLAAWLSGLGKSLGSVPKAVVVVSGHWEEEQFTVTTRRNPPLLYDYYGFPEHTYKLKYEAPGEPALARRICELLGEAGIPAGSNSERGFDHGVFIPFKLIYPNADIPMIQLSLKTGLDPATHLAAGRAIESLRREGVLIVGSGMSYHNLNGFFSGAGDRADQFDTWLTDTVSAPDAAARAETLGKWRSAPSARDAHPREEHLIPLMVAAGAAHEDLGSRVYSERIMGAMISAYQFGHIRLGE